MMIAIVALGLLLGGVAVWFWMKGRFELVAIRERLIVKEEEVAQLRADLAERAHHIQALQEETTNLKTEGVKIETARSQEKVAADEKLTFLSQTQNQLVDTFKALSGDALKHNNQVFLDLAQSRLTTFQEGAQGDLEKRQQAIRFMVAPILESLTQFNAKVETMEKTRVGAYEGLSQQVKGLMEVQHQWRSQTDHLVRALSAPRVRGRWGEIQLRRVVELAGMLNHCDFYEQQSTTTEGGRLRPDLIVRLPGGKQVVVDAKAPLAAYLDALEENDPARQTERLREHARHIREHVAALSRKAYWDQFQPAPEFVVLFLPGESFFSAALSQDPSLIEVGVDQRVILATPTTLIALLKAVAYGWRQDQQDQHAQEISRIGKELYERLGSLAGHFSDMGDRLNKAVESYNKLLGSLESRVLVSARRLQAHLPSETDTELAPSAPIETSPRSMQSPELLSQPELSSPSDSDRDVAPTP